MKTLKTSICRYSTLLTFAASLLFYACSNGAPDTGEYIDLPADSSQITPPPPKDTLHRIKLSFVGDIMGHGEQIQSAFDPNTETYNYEPCFRYVKPILDQADLAIGNLEVTFNAKGVYKGYPRFRSPDALGTALKGASFDFLVTANNHSNDNGIYGLTHTLDTIDAMGFIHTGTFYNQAHRDSTYPLIIEQEVDGTTFKLAFINCTYGTNGIPTEAPSIVNLIDEKAYLKDIEKAKAAKPDMIIALMHWGREYKLDEHIFQKHHTQILWDNGVDVVIGAHPHVIQPVKTNLICNEDSSECRDVLVTYSLGNFISNQFRENTDIGLIFELELVKNSKTGKTTIGNHDYIFAWRYIHNRSEAVVKRTHIAVPVSAFENDSTNFLQMTDSDISKMKKTTERMRKHLGKWQSKERKISFEEVVLPGIDPPGNPKALMAKEENK